MIKLFWTHSLDKEPIVCNTGNTMARNTAIVSISLPQEMLIDLIKWAKLERKTKTELVREALQWYKRWRLKREITELRKTGEKIRKEFNLKTEDDLYKFIHGD